MDNQILSKFIENLNFKYYNDNMLKNTNILDYYNEYHKKCIDEIYLENSNDSDYDGKLDNKSVYFFINGWYKKDLKLCNYIIKFNKNIICYSCKSVCKLSNIKFSKTVPFKKIRNDVYKIYKNNSENGDINDSEIEEKLKTMINTYCICNKCYNILDINDIPFAPKNLNDILNRYDSNLNYENYRNVHKTLTERNGKLFKDIKKLERDNNNMVIFNNKLKKDNKKMKQYLTINKIKNDQLNLIKDDNCKMFKKLSIESLKIFHEFKKQTVKEFNNVNLIIDDFIANNNIECGNYKLECKLCSNSEIECTLNCGHMYCNSCVNKLKINYKNNMTKYRDYIQNDEIDNQYEFDTKPQLLCPECRCAIKKVTPLYFT